jgi:hypothetical protein
MKGKPVQIFNRMKNQKGSVIISACIFLTMSYSLDAQIKEREIVTIPLKIDTTTLKGISREILDQEGTIHFTTAEAIRFLQAKYRADYWKNSRDSLRQYLNQLIFYAAHEPVRDVTGYLSDYPYEFIKIPAQDFYVWDTIRIRLPSGHERDSVAFRIMEEALVRADSTGLRGRFDHGKIAESLGENLLLKGDTLLLVLVDTLREVTLTSSSFPFRGYNHPFIGDSIQAAIEELIRHLQRPDSVELMLTGSASTETPFWLNSQNNQLVRFWLRNEYDDSVTVWVGSTEYNTIGLYLENNIMFRRPSKAINMVDARIDLPVVDNKTLREVQTLYVKPDYWRFNSEMSFVLNQAYLTNWVKGGESNISSVMDFTTNVNYLNNSRKILWYNQGRFKHGFISSRDYGIRRNVDLVELSSKLNTKAFGKFDFSSTALFKTQMAKGYNYPKDKDPVLVSRILSPATITVGVGLDYKPNKETSINFAPLSYKGTFVNDTVRVDQQKYGIPADRKARHEPGASLLVNHKFSPFKNITMTNKLQLFTNFIDKPQNVDIDWEMIATTSLNWFTDVRINTHFIFDDNTKTVEYDKNGDAILGDDGKPKKTARIQFKEIIGFTLVFRF